MKFGRPHTAGVIFRRRMRVVIAGVVIMNAALVMHLFVLQLKEQEQYGMMAEDNRLHWTAVAPTRGTIYDRNGELLAGNRTIYRIEVMPAVVADMDATLQGLQEILDFRDDEIRRFRKELEEREVFQHVVLKDQLSDREVALFAVNQYRFSGVRIAGTLGRYYPQADVFAHAVGYLGKLDHRDLQRIDRSNYRNNDYIGKVGIERRYEKQLRGRSGARKVEVNAEGRVLRTVEIIKPQSGSDVKLSLDVDLQVAAYQALGDAEGAVVAVDPRNGEILVLVSKPSFDPNRFLRGMDSDFYREMIRRPYRPFFNRAISGQYPPGSIIKPVVALAGLESGVTSAHYQMNAGPYFSLPGSERRFRDWKEQGHGWVDLRTSLAQSCDVFFYDLSYRIGIDRLQEFFTRFRLGTASNVDLVGEYAGLVPSRTWKRAAYRLPWYPEETLITGIGQGYLLTTPIQLAMVAATIGSRGIMVQPRLVKEVRHLSGHGWKPTATVVTGKLDFAEQNWDLVIDGMVDAVRRPGGTAYRTGHDAPYFLAGKTGTAQVYNLGEDRKYNVQAEEKHLRDHALFIAFAPVDDPRIAVAVVVEHGGSGARVAAPVARRILDVYFDPLRTAAQTGSDTVRSQAG